MLRRYVGCDAVPRTSDIVVHLQSVSEVPNSERETYYDVNLVANSKRKGLELHSMHSHLCSH